MKTPTPRRAADSLLKSGRRQHWRQGGSALALAIGLACLASAADAREQPETVALRYLQQNAQRLGLSGADTREATVSSTVPGTAVGLSHVYLQQRLRGIPVWNGMLTLNVLGTGQVVNPGNRFIANLNVLAGKQKPARSPVQAAHAAAAFLDLKLQQPFRAISRRGGAAQRTTLSTGGVAREAVEAELVWFFAQDMQQLRLAWRLQINEAGGRHEWNVFVDATTGEPLAAKDRIVRDQASAISAAVGRGPGVAGLLASNGALLAAAPTPAAPFPNIDGASYTVYPMPYESPSDGGRVAVSGAASPAASPYGWHDTNGAAGAEYTRTRGNNVHAYTDTDNNDSADAGSDPDVGAGLKFDFPLLAGQAPAAHRPAAVTNLFYWNNIVHDVTYNYGFNEASGNFQYNNYGRGGIGTDYVKAEAQDGSDTDNANFSTPPDGAHPRMQMFEWTFPFPNTVAVSSPASIAGSYIATAAEFGPAFSASGPRAGALVLANDGGGPGTASDACEPLVGFPSGAIALFDRGSCNFTVKAKNAQIAGAIAAIGINNIAGPPITMGGTDASVTIPAGMVSLADGTLLKNNAPVTATAQANPSPPVNRDSDFDATVLVHEYGHGISNRLTGGPETTSCLDNAEQMGEGWSDFLAMVMTTRPSDTGVTPRGSSTYLNFEGSAGVGIRPTQYSTSLGVNPSTYASVADTAGISSPHGIGYVWTSMLWEVYWNLVHRHGYNANLYESWNTGGNNLAMQLVMDGMKFQTCSPGFVDGRDAILAADTTLTGGANRCEIWRGFAKRGLGHGATQGSSSDRSDGVQAFDLPAACKVATFGGFQAPVAAAPALNPVAYGDNVLMKFRVSGSSNPIVDSQPVSCTTLEPTGVAPRPLRSAAGLVRSGDNFQLDWQMDKAWARTCRAVTVRLPAASDAVAYFRFGEAPQKVRGR